MPRTISPAVKYMPALIKGEAQRARRGDFITDDQGNLVGFRHPVTTNVVKLPSEVPLPGGAGPGPSAGGPGPSATPPPLAPPSPSAEGPPPPLRVEDIKALLERGVITEQEAAQMQARAFFPQGLPDIENMKVLFRQAMEGKGPLAGQGGLKPLARRLTQMGEGAVEGVLGELIRLGGPAAQTQTFAPATTQEQAFGRQLGGTVGGLVRQTVAPETPLELAMTAAAVPGLPGLALKGGRAAAEAARVGAPALAEPVLRTASGLAGREAGFLKFGRDVSSIAQAAPKEAQAAATDVVLQPKDVVSPLGGSRTGAGQLQKQIGDAIATPPSGVPPRPPIERVPPGPGAPTPPPDYSRIIPDLPSADEMAQAITSPDNVRKLSNLPGINKVAGIFNPSAVANRADQIYLIGRQKLRDVVSNNAGPIYARLGRLGKSEQVFGAVDEDGLIKAGALKGLAVNDIRTNPSKYALTAAQKAWIDEADLLERAKLDLLRRNGIEVRELAFPEGGQYAGRRVFGKVGPDGELIDSAMVGAGRGRPGAKLAAEKQRAYATAGEAIKDGYRYLPDDEALYLNILGAYNRVADKTMTDWFLTQVPWRTGTTPEALLLAKEAAQRRADVAERFVNVLSRAQRGERLPAATVSSIANLFPTEGNKLRAALQVAEVSQQRSFLRTLAPDARGLLKSARAELTDAVTKAASARSRAVTRGFEEGIVAAPAFGGKILTGPGAREMARNINASLADQGSVFLRAINQSVNAVARYFKLSADLSVATIQLIILPFYNPTAFAKAVAGFARALPDAGFAERYMASNADDILGFTRAGGIILKGGRTEFTEALGPGGILRKGPLRLPAKALDPFQRAFETAEDMAGAEMWKSLRHLATDPDRARQVAQFINEIRGVTSSRAIGVSITQQQLETGMFLAPRYNRAIASLLFDAFRGNLRGQEARRALMQFTAGMALLAVATDLAQGKTIKDALGRIDPRSRDFFTWTVAGQRVGPGSKIRSVLKLLGDSAEQPEHLVELSTRNLGLRFVRANLSPVMSSSVDILTGQNYIGEATRGDIPDLAKSLLADNVLPVWVQTVLMEGGTVSERLTRGAAEFAGGRGYPDVGVVTEAHRDAARRVFDKNFYDLSKQERTVIQGLAPEFAMAKAAHQAYQGVDDRLLEELQGQDKALWQAYLHADAKARSEMERAFGPRLFALKGEVDRRRAEMRKSRLISALLHKWYDFSPTGLTAEEMESLLPTKILETRGERLLSEAAK